LKLLAVKPQTKQYKGINQHKLYKISLFSENTSETYADIDYNNLQTLICVAERPNYLR